MFMKHGNPKLTIRYAKQIIKAGEGRTSTKIVLETKAYELIEELAKYRLEEFKHKIIDNIKIYL